MTVVVALKDKENNDVIIGSDTMISGGNLNRRMDGPKFFTVEIPLAYKQKTETIVVGEAGLVTVLEYMKRVYKPPVWNQKNEDFNTYMLNSFFPTFKKLLENKVYIGKDKEDGTPNNFSNLLIIYNNEFYKMWDDFGFDRYIEDYCCIGSGTQVALGSLHSTKEFLYDNPKARVEKAITASGELTTFVNTDIHISKVSELISETKK